MENVQVYRFKKEPDFVPNGKKAMLFEFRKTRPQKPQIENIGEVHKVCGG
jgi:hypothetical protein